MARKNPRKISTRPAARAAATRSAATPRKDTAKVLAWRILATRPKESSRSAGATRRPSAGSRPPVVFVATAKGAFFLRNVGAGAGTIDGPHLLGSKVHHVVLDPRDRKTLLLAARTGHLGPTVFRSTDLGKSWQEAGAPPRFPKTSDGTGRAVNHVFWLTPGHPTEPGVWYAGTSPQGLFRSEDGGRTWAGVKGFNDHPLYRDWTGGEQDGTPDGPKLHSILIDPRDARRLYIGMSSGGVFTSDDQGESWRPLNRGVVNDFLPTPDAEYGHDPHQVELHPLRPDRLYQQNHCGIYRLDRVPGGEDRWLRIGEKMPREVGDIGFPIVLHPRDPDTAWVIPMDGTTVWPRTSVGGKPAVYVTRDAGASWQRLDRGLPREQAWLTVKRQAFTSDGGDPLGLYFGTTSGSIWASFDGGGRWREVVRHLPQVYAVTCGRTA